MDSKHMFVAILMAFTAVATHAFNCTFDQGLCGWTQSHKDNFDWERRNTDEDNTADTGPAHDHTGDGYYMFTNSKDYTLYQTAVLVSPLVNMTANQQKCFQFFYLMHGVKVGTLNVFLSPDGSMNNPVWSRVGTQGIFYLLGQITLNNSGWVMIEGSGSAGNDGNIAIDDVGLTDGPCTSQTTHNSYKSLTCDFELDQCGYIASGNGSGWHRTVGESLMLEDTFDHTTRTATGFFITINNNNNVNKTVSLMSENITSQGSYCVTFFYREQGSNFGLLSVSVLDYSKNVTAQLWQDMGTAVASQWNKAQFSLNITSVIQLSFDAAISSDGDGDLSVDDINVQTDSCETPPDCSFDKYNLCSWVNDFIHNVFDWEIATSGSDAKILAPWRDADDNVTGGFILLDMGSNPSMTEAYLVSETIRLRGSQCFNFYFYPLVRSSEFEETPMVLNIYVNTGEDFPGPLYWTYSMTEPTTTFVYGQLPLEMNTNYRIIIGGFVTLGQVMSMDKFSLLASGCTYLPGEAKPSASSVSITTPTATTRLAQPSSSMKPHSLWDCDFETTSCHWKSNQVANSTWTRRQPGYYLNGPHFDHTTGPGGHGYFLTLDTVSGKLQTDTALKANTNYCLVFWVYLYGSTEFEFTVQTMNTSSTILMYKQHSLGTIWNQMTLDLPISSVAYNIEFIYDQITPGSRNQLALDDIQVSEGQCSLEVGPNCTFDRGYCNWGNSKDNDFNFTLSTDKGQDSGEIQIDHTTETVLGSFIKATTNGHSEGQKAHFQSSKLTFNDSVCMRYYYYVTSSCDSDLGIETLGPQDRHSVPLLDLQDIMYDIWQLSEVTIYDPEDTQVLFTFTVGQNTSCQIGIDDVEFIDGECLYRGTTDFENGFDVFHNVYSSDFNWVIASPSDGIFTWLPANDFSTNSPNGHFAVAAYSYSSSTGKKAELWGQLSPPMNFYCTSFYLYVHGNDPGTLNVTLVDYLDDTRVVVWSYTPSIRNRDAQIYAQFPHVYPRQFYVVFTVILGSEGNWAIDSIDMFPSATCRVIPTQAEASTVAPPTVSPPTTAAFSDLSNAGCDFETDLCNWYIPAYSNFNWTRTSGGDVDLPFSPKQGRPGGKKFFLTLSKFPPAGSTSAILQSQTFNAGNNTRKKFDFRLWLNMDGEHVGMFTIELNTVSISQTVFYSDTATTSWEQIEISVNVTGPFTLTIVGQRNSYDLDSISIDDIEVSDADVLDDGDDDVYKCTFESPDLCGFKQDSSDNLDWAWVGNQPDVLMQDHTYLTNLGHAMLVYYTQGKPGDIARLVSTTVPPMSGCLTFWLMMVSDGAALRVYVVSAQQEELISQKRNTQGYVWVKSETPVSSNVPFHITLEAEVLAERTSDLIIDDFQLSSTACATQGACTFERDTCTWQNSLISGADFDWIRGTGATVGVTGPAVDSTTGSADGYFMYIDSSGPYKYQDKAWFDSATFPKGVQCVHFYYHMSGVSVGTLNVYTLELDSVDSTMVWSLSGDQGKDWNSAMVTVGTDLVNYNVRFEGALGFSVTSNIAIDDIIFMPDTCDVQPSDANAFTLSTTPTTVTNTSSQVILEECDFDDDFPCGFKNGTSDNFWVRAGPNMSVSDTLKPFNGHTTSRNNSFIYAQVGDDLKENSTARFVSPVYAVRNGEAKCLEFYYHMNGDQVGQLNVYIAPDGKENSLTNDMCLWSQNFDSGPGWKKGLVPIYQSTNYHVVFEAVCSNLDYYYGIDDLKIFDNQCEPSESCDFEVDSCLWTNEGGETDSDIPWNRYQGEERTALFAPTVDHTMQKVDGHYMFVESSLTSAGSVARLYSQVFAGSSSPYCLHFWYYMFGPKLGHLKVFVRNTISSSSYYSDADLWQLDRPAGNDWFLAQVNISRVYTKKPFMVIIEAAVGSTLEGAFGIDDTQFEAADCAIRPSAAKVTANPEMVPNCDFDDGDTCDWTSPYAMYKFTVTSAGGTIPFEHDGGTGDFLLADSKKLPENSQVTLLSPLLPPTFGTSCLTLWYNQQDSGQSDLSLSLITDGTEGSELFLWEAYAGGDTGWLSVAINIQNNFDYKIQMDASVGTYDGGSVAVDDIRLVHGACHRSEIITFEEGLSGFSPTTSSNVNWVIELARDSFVFADHTYQTGQGHVLQADLGSAATALKTAEIKSPLYPSVGDECMEFWYAKKGSSGSFNVKISENGPDVAAGDSDPLWQTAADTNLVLKQVLVDISSEYPYWIIFQVTGNNSQVNDIVIIDDISFRTEACPSVVNCDFDLDNCDYTGSTDAMFYWKAVKGAYSDSLMPFDQTLQSAQGLYMEIDFPNSLNTFTSDLISPVEKQITSKCLIFWYYGSGGGTLQVFAQTNTSQRQSLVVKTISPDKIETKPYRGWEEVQVDVNSTAPYSIVFEAVNERPVTSFVIDSVKLMNGTCASLAETTDTRPPVGTLLDPKTAMLGCDFEKSDFCNFTSGDGRSFAWKMFSFGSSHSPETGVNFDHTKNNIYGHHVFMDASGHKFNTTARLVSPSFVNDKFVCLSFYYAMYGRDVNRLNVYIAQGQTDTLFWTRSDNQGEGWHHQMVEIGEVPQATQIVFEGVVGRSDQGDIDLDDIWIFDGRCPPPEYCDFEDSEICQMDQDNLDDADWTIQPAALATGSDPKVDHTYGTDQGSYLLLDMTKTKSNQVARIFTRQYNADSARCLTFWFHFTDPPSKSHTLTVSLQDERGIGTTLIVLRGIFTEEWTQAIFPLAPTENFQIVFEGRSGGSGGNIALDDITVSPDECESYIDCDFESHDMCGWDIVPEHSAPPWEVTPPNHYMTLNFTAVNSSAVQFSQVQSQIIPPGMHDQFCFTFNYMMYGVNVGYLNISIEVEYPEAQTIVIFSIYGDQGRDTWRYAYADNPQIDLGISRFVITGSTAATASNSTETSAILVSDIVVVLEPCTEWVTQKEAFFPCSADFQIPMSSVCDFIDDCVGNLDEIICGTCNFEKDYCNWQDDSTGTQKFTAVGAIPNVVFTDAHPGKFLTLQRAQGITGGTGDLVFNQELGPSPYNCMMVFSYYMSVESQALYGNLYVSIEENNEETVVWESSQGNTTNWQTASVDVGSIKARFKIHFASKYLPFDNAMGIDDIRFKGCSFAEVNNGTCENKFICKRNGACIDSSTKLCDFTDECGDSSDEDPNICGDYLMDNFEDSFGDWSQDGHDGFDWSRHSGRWISSSSGPRRDHTLGTHFGHYLLCESGTHPDGQVARLISPEFLPTNDTDCKIRFYYHMHGSDQGQLTLYMTSKTTGRTQQLVQYVTKLYDDWLFGSSNLTSTDNFQIIFEGKVIGEHSTDIGLDDITFTPQCQLKNPSSHRPGTTVSVTTSQSSVFTSRPATTATDVSTERQLSTEQGSSTGTSSASNIPETTTPETITPVTTTPVTTTSETTTSETTTPETTAKSSGFTTRESAATTKAGITEQTGSTTTSRATTKPATQGSSVGTDSGSWKVPVGVVLGLLGLVAVIAGVIIYFRHTRTFNWMTFPLLRKTIRVNRGETNPAFEYDTTGDTAISMTEKKSISGSINEIFGQNTELPIMSETYVGLPNPLYSET